MRHNCCTSVFMSFSIMHIAWELSYRLYMFINKLDNVLVRLKSLIFER